MNRTRIRIISGALLLCLVGALLWLLFQEEEGESKNSRGAAEANAPSGTEEIPSIPEWESEPEPVKPVSRKAPGEEEFLSTDYEPFDRWLNERFKVDYKHMSPQLIFDQVPLNDIYYETVALPEKPPGFNLKSSDISRRELLQKIAEFWDLEMSIVTDESGNPTAVQILAPGFYR